MKTFATEAEREADNAAYRRTNEHAVMDSALPVFVRAFLVLNDLPASEKFVLDEAGILGEHKLYGGHKGQPVRVVVVSRLGDVGISEHDARHGYFKRCSIYDITNYSETPTGALKEAST